MKKMNMIMVVCAAAMMLPTTAFAQDKFTVSGKRCYSSYINAAYEMACPVGVTLTPAIGFTPWKGYYHDKAAFTDISLKASKALVLSDKFSLPIFVQAIASPINDHVYLVAGVGIGF